MVTAFVYFCLAANLVAAVYICIGLFQYFMSHR